MKICVLGLGYVGATTMACLAELGHHMVGVDIRPEKVASLKRGESPVLEPGVEQRLKKYLQSGLIEATTDIQEAVKNTDACLVCVGTPSSLNGGVDSTQLVNVITQVAAIRAENDIVRPIFMRSTALPSVHKTLIGIIDHETKGKQHPAYICFPEFLREGVAVSDFFEPPKVVFGTTDETALEFSKKIASHFDGNKCFYTTVETAALVKYVDNCFHAVKVTFANEVGMLAHNMGVDSRDVLEIFRSDEKLNISTYYLKPGPAFGGSCLPKDLRAVNNWCGKNDVRLPMLGHVMDSNQTQLETLAQRIFASGAENIGFFGLAFKQDTDDLRESPMVALAEKLYGKGKNLLIYDPALAGADLIGSNLNYALQTMPHFRKSLTSDATEVVNKSDVIVAIRPPQDHEWSELPFREDQILFDLWGKDDTEGIKASVEGLYW